VISNNRKHSNRIKNRFSQLYRWDNNYSKIKNNINTMNNQLRATDS